VACVVPGHHDRRGVTRRIARLAATAPRNRTRLIGLRGARRYSIAARFRFGTLPTAWVLRRMPRPPAIRNRARCDRGTGTGWWPAARPSGSNPVLPQLPVRCRMRASSSRYGPITLRGRLSVDALRRHHAHRTPALPVIVRWCSPPRFVR
jgi:hypothetical protein